MKIRRIIFYLLLFTLYSCVPYKSYQKNDTICELGMEFQDYEKIFDKNLKPLVSQGQAIDSGSFITSYFAYSRENGFSLAKTNKQDTIMKIMKYDMKGRIQSACYSYSNVYLDESYRFDTLGNIIEIKDERQADKYPICFREALEIVKRKTPKYYVINVIERDSMIIDNQKVYHWEISTRNPKKYYSYHYSINAQTGKVIKKGISRVVYDSPD